MVMLISERAYDGAVTTVGGLEAVAAEAEVAAMADAAAQSLVVHGPVVRAVAAVFAVAESGNLPGLAHSAVRVLRCGGVDAVTGGPDDAGNGGDDAENAAEVAARGRSC